MTPHAPRLWGRKAAVVLAAHGKQITWKNPSLGGGLQQGLFPKAASTRTLQHHLNPYARTHTHPPHAHARNSLLAILTSLRTGFCPSSAWICKEEDCNLFIFFVSWHSLATFPVWTAHPHSHYAVRFLSEWMSSLLWLRLVSLELFLQH